LVAGMRCMSPSQQTLGAKGSTIQAI
jgi:hypothetical protein